MILEINDISVDLHMIIIIRFTLCGLYRLRETYFWLFSYGCQGLYLTFWMLKLVMAIIYMAFP